MCMPSSNAGDIARQQQQQEQQTLDQATSKIGQAFSGFDQNYFDKITQAYENYANPQLTAQYMQQMKTLQAGLAGQGLEKSSAASNLTGLLNQNLAQEQRGVVNSGIQQAQTAQQNVAQQENTLVNQAEASADPLSIAQGALSAASSIRAPSTFAPVGNFFSNWASIYGGNQQATALNNNNALLNSALYSGALGNTAGGFAPLGNSGVIR